MRCILLLLLCLGLPAWADLDYRLKPRQIAEGTWLLEGSTDNFAKDNGGNIVNTAFIVTDNGWWLSTAGRRNATAKHCARPLPPPPTSRWSKCC